MRFSGFYKVRRSASWRDQYYSLMESAKTQSLAFPQVLRALKERTDRIEASFASKLVATLDPRTPVIDKFVLSHFGLRLPGRSTEDRESRTIEIYNELCRRYEDLLGSPLARMICAKFAQTYPWANITDLKKVDLLLWQIRGRKSGKIATQEGG